MNERVVRFAFRAYKSLVSPLIHAIVPSRCLYLPTCSEYAYVAVVRFGVLRGSWMALCRLLRCHPWGRGGLDPVPSAVEMHTKSSFCNHSPQTKAPKLL
jgi:putative membrane protein insertion efficiency factor